MRFNITDAVYLTTEHATSSYGVPVLVVGTEALGPADMLPGHDITAADVIRLWAQLSERTEDERRAALRFLSAVR